VNAYIISSTHAVRHQVPIYRRLIYRKPFNDIYIAPSSDFKLNTGIGIGSAAEDVQRVYQNTYHSKESSKHLFIAGERYGWLIFIIDNDKVSTIYSAAGAYSGVDDPRQIQ
jgi:hypothetical protein